MQPFQYFSIRQRLTLIIMSISAVTVLATTLAISIIGVYNLRANLISELDLSAAIVGDRNRAALLFGRPDQAMNNLNVMEVRPQIVQACLYNGEGEEFAAYTNQKYAGKVSCSKNMQVRALFTGEHIELMKIIEGDFGITGYIYLESNLDQIHHYIRNQTKIALSVTLGAIFLSYLLAVNLQKAISQPLLHLASVARHVTEHKDYSVRAKQQGVPNVENKNELVILTHSFNNMLVEIGGRDKQLKAQNVELQRSRDAAESSNRAKSQFLANISHELRTPLNAIIGFSSILMNQLFGPLGDAKYMEYAKDINDSGAHLLDIINDILDLSKAEAGKLTLSFEEVHVAKAIQKCLTIMSERAEKGEVKIVTQIPKTLPLVVVDRLRFIQIVLNILSNAVKFTNPGGVVTLSVAPKETEGRFTHFSVVIEDNGIGMTADDIQKAFQSFGQVDSGLNRKYEGTGLGLPLTKKLIELHHADIGIESEIGKGTTVTLTFPAIPAEGFVSEQDDR